jgi:acylphosphatase
MPADPVTNRAIKANVTGKVQGVGFRQSCRQIARANDLYGWVGNRSDGSVDVFAQGSGEAIDLLVAWLWTGPPAAKVSGVESDAVAADNTLRDFFIHPDPSKTG